MKLRLFSFVMVASLLLASQSVAQVTSGQPAPQTRQQQQGRRSGPPLTPDQFEQAVRQTISSTIQRRLVLPDSQLARLSALTFRYRDSTLRLNERERFVRRQLDFEDGNARNLAPNEQRIECLLGEFWRVQEMRMNLRLAEDREITTFLSPSKRLRYLSFQENLHETIDDAVDQFNRRQGGRNGRLGGGGPPPAGAVQGQPPPAGARVGGAPPGDAPPRGARPGGPPLGRGAFAGICPARGPGE